MNEDKLKQFIRNKSMAKAVYDFLLDSFLVERNDKDVHVLAASRLSVSYLKQGWKQLSKYELDEEESPPSLKQVGL